MQQLIGLDENPLFAFMHGYTGCGNNIWFPYAFTTVADNACEFVSPDLPSPAAPVYDEWKSTILNSIKAKWNKKQKIILVGHSLGGHSVLRIFAECSIEATTKPDDDKTFNEWTKYVVAIFVVSPIADMDLYPNKFRGYDKKVNWEFYQKLDLPIRLIYNLRDQDVHPDNFALVVKNLKGIAKDFKHVEMDTAAYHGHFGGAGHFPVKEINEIILELIKITKK